MCNHNYISKSKRALCIKELLAINKNNIFIQYVYISIEI